MVGRRLVEKIDLRPSVAGCVRAALRDKNGITRSGVVGKKSVAGEGVEDVAAGGTSLMIVLFAALDWSKKPVKPPS